MIRLDLNEFRGEFIIKEALKFLKDGKIVAYPTETFYALGVRYDSHKGLKRLYEIKRRPFEKSSALIVGSMDVLGLVARDLSQEHLDLIDRFWPGPLTILFRAKEGLSEFICSKRANTLGSKSMVAARMPGESFALTFAKSVGFPITATSANISGFPPASTPVEVEESFPGEIDLLIGVDRTPGGLPSTLVKIENKQMVVMRQGKCVL